MVMPSASSSAPAPSFTSPFHSPFPKGFELPEALSAKEPPEKRGLSRDGIRMLVAGRDGDTLAHARFHQLPDYLRAGDCLVFNASRTLPASLRAWLDPDCVNLQLRLARRWEDGAWSALVLDAAEEPWRTDLRGRVLTLGGGLKARVLEKDPIIDRLWRIRFDRSGSELMEILSRLGNPIRYWYASGPWDLDYYQTVYAREPGSMEMPSAGRAFSWKLLMDLRRKGVRTAFLVLHAGLSSYMDEAFDAGHPASEESFRISPVAAETINDAKSTGGRIIAVGTTVVRALETVADGRGMIKGLEGSTRLRVTREHQLRSVDGLITGLHEPQASHLDLLSAFLSKEKLDRVYAEAIREQYLWHEFGDANLIL
jgi:S-adenosylmethionine:tRNA ribosyltransferase-isomerase